MRVISGDKKGSKLKTLEGMDTRPTTDRVKESLFNIIQWQISESYVLDLFAGSGGLGIEALSRGAKAVVFVDSNKNAIGVIKQNLSNLNLLDKAKVLCENFQKVLNNNEKYDIIFLDPPYKTDYIEVSLNLIYKHKLLSKNGLIICESDKDKIIKSNFEIKKEACYGNTKLSILELGD